MPRCIVLAITAVLSGNMQVQNVSEETEHPQIECMGEKCQLWDTTRGDCGLKHSSQSLQSVIVPRPILTDRGFEEGVPLDVLLDDSSPSSGETKPNFHQVDNPPPASDPE
jgi:hypothetical protein